MIEFICWTCGHDKFSIKTRKREKYVLIACRLQQNSRYVIRVLRIYVFFLSKIYLSVVPIEFGWYEGKIFTKISCAIGNYSFFLTLYFRWINNDSMHAQIKTIPPIHLDAKEKHSFTAVFFSRSMKYTFWDSVELASS